MPHNETGGSPITWKQTLIGIKVLGVPVAQVGDCLDAWNPDRSLITAEI